MKNTLSDLNNALFAQIERLNDEDLTPEKLKTEVERSKAMTDVAQKIIDNASLQLEAAQIIQGGNGKHGMRGTVEKLPRVIGLIAANEVQSIESGEKK